MSDPQTNLAVAALAIALVALVTTVLQVFQQYLATADGFRRCQASVLGPWSRFTRLRWRYSEFRYETLFTTPEISVRDMLEPTSIPMVGDLDDSRDNLLPPAGTLRASTELVGWILLLRALKEETITTLRLVLSPEAFQALQDDDRVRSRSISRVKRSTGRPSPTPEKIGSGGLNVQGGFPVPLPVNTFTGPYVARRERSWDFMPPDVVRPYAVTTIGDIGILARRLGMRWLDFRPADGILKAEGCGHVLTSTTVRSVGLMLQYLYTAGDQTGIPVDDRLRLPEDGEDRDENYIPRPEADGMGFGILPGFKALRVPDVGLTDENGAVDTMRRLGCSMAAVDELKSIFAGNEHWTPGFSDIIGMAAPVLRVRGSTLVQVPAPAKYWAGLTCEREGFMIYHHRLQGMIGDRKGRDEEPSPQMNWLLQQYEQLRDGFGVWEEHRPSDPSQARSIDFLEHVHDRWDATTRYFLNLQDDHGLPYLDLVTCHIEHAVFWWKHSRDKNESFDAREHFDTVAWISDGMHMYFDDLPAMVQWMNRRQKHDEHMLVEAWLTLVFRAFCWHRLHSMVEGPTIPSSFYRSRMPVYIG